MFAATRVLQGGYAAPPGQVVFTGTSAADLSQTWVVPEGVYAISAVVVGAYGQADARIKRSSTTLLSVYDTIGTNGVGGGNGGGAGNPGGSYGPLGRAGSGGAGGYTGNGGNGGSTSSGGSDVINGTAGTNGSGGGGGGGGAGVGSFGYYGSGASGGGVGLLGTGSSGTGGAAGVPGGNVNGTPGGSGSAGTNKFGAGYTHPDYGQSAGGNLRWKNDIPVTPGETLTITANRGSVGGYYVPSSLEHQAGIRIMWGGGRSYPSNAGDV